MPTVHPTFPSHLHFHFHLRLKLPISICHLACSKMCEFLWFAVGSKRFLTAAFEMGTAGQGKCIHPPPGVSRIHSSSGKSADAALVCGSESP